MLLLPVVIVVLAGLNAGEYLTFPPQGLSLRWVGAFLTSPTFMGAYLYSFVLALAATLISTVLGTLAAIYLSRSPGGMASVLRGFFMLPIVLPGVVLGLALYIFYISTDIGLARTFGGLLIGHVLVTFPFVIATVTASMVGFDLSLEEAARSLGASPWAAFRKITLRLHRAGRLRRARSSPSSSRSASSRLSLFLTVPNHEPLPMAMYISLRYKFEPTAAAAGIFAIALVAISTVVSARLVNLRRVFRA